MLLSLIDPKPQQKDLNIAVGEPEALVYVERRLGRVGQKQELIAVEVAPRQGGLRGRPVELGQGPDDALQVGQDLGITEIIIY